MEASFTGPSLTQRCSKAMRKSVPGRLSALLRWPRARVRIAGS
jgi:hypothetical protein